MKHCMKYIALVIILAMTAILSGCSNEVNVETTEAEKIIQSLYKNHALLSIKLSDDEAASMILNSNREAYMENGADIRVYTKNDKACIMTTNVEVVAELSPVRLVEEIVMNSSSNRSEKISYIDNSIMVSETDKDVVCYIYEVSGYNELNNLLLKGGQDYAAYILATYKIEEASNVRLEAITYSGVRKYIGGSTNQCELYKYGSDGYGSIAVSLYVDNKEYIIYSIQTVGLLKSDFILDKEWYTDNDNIVWAQLAKKLSNDIKNLIYDN